MKPILSPLTALLATFLLSSCERSAPPSAAIPDDRDRIKVAADAASRLTGEITRQLQGIYGTNGAINVHVQVGDIVLVGFDEAIDAEEWGMVDNQVEGGDGAKSKGKATPATDAGTTREKSVRSVDIRKGNLVLVAAEETNAAGEEPSAPAVPESAAKPKKP